MLNLNGLESCGFPLPTISFIIFHDFCKFVWLNSNCSSIYSFSLFLRSEVNLLLEVVYSSLLSMVGFFSYACFRICLVLIDTVICFISNFYSFIRETVLKSVHEFCVKDGR